MEGLGGIEPPTPWFVATRSSPLSYKPIGLNTTIAYKLKYVNFKIYTQFSLLLLLLELFLI